MEPEQSHCGSIGPGFFSFQFQFVILSHVPSSFEFQGRRNASANISYKIEARAVSTGVIVHKALAKILIAQLTSITGANQAAPVRQVNENKWGASRSAVLLAMWSLLPSCHALGIASQIRT